MVQLKTLKSFLCGLFCALTALLVTSSANAVTIDGTVPSRGIEYIFFTHNGGDLSIALNGGTLRDPEISLFVDDGSVAPGLTGAFVGNDDDGGIGLDSLLTLESLTPGNYVLAVGAWNLLEREARSGIASTPFFDGTFQAVFSGDVSFPSTTVSADLSSVPLPAALPLLIGGLLGLMFAGRRGRRTTVQ